MNKNMQPEVLNEKIENINVNIKDFKENTGRSFEDLKGLIKEFQSDLSLQIRSTNLRIDLLHGTLEQSKADRRELHKEVDAHSVKITAEELVLKELTDKIVKYENNVRGAKSVYSTLLSIIGFVGVAVAAILGLLSLIGKFNIS